MFAVQSLLWLLHSQQKVRSLTFPTLNDLLTSLFLFVDSDLPDSIVSPTDEETCSYVTDGEEQFDVGDTVSSCSDVESPSSQSILPIVADVVVQPALRFSPFPTHPPYLNFCLHDEKGKLKKKCAGFCYISNLFSELVHKISPRASVAN